MNKSFCSNCGRTHEWPDGAFALCYCGQVQEPQTENELETLKSVHWSKLIRITVVNTLRPGDEVIFEGTAPNLLRKTV